MGGFFTLKTKFRNCVVAVLGIFGCSVVIQGAASANDNPVRVVLPAEYELKGGTQGPVFRVTEDDVGVFTIEFDAEASYLRSELARRDLLGAGVRLFRLPVKTIHVESLHSGFTDRIIRDESLLIGDQIAFRQTFTSSLTIAEIRQHLSSSRVFATAQFEPDCHSLNVLPECRKTTWTVPVVNPLLADGLTSVARRALEQLEVLHWFRGRALMGLIDGVPPLQPAELGPALQKVVETDAGRCRPDLNLDFTQVCKMVKKELGGGPFDIDQAIEEISQRAYSGASSRLTSGLGVTSDPIVSEESGFVHFPDSTLRRSRNDVDEILIRPGFFLARPGTGVFHFHRPDFGLWSAHAGEEGSVRYSFDGSKVTDQVPEGWRGPRRIHANISLPLESFVRDGLRPRLISLEINVSDIKNKHDRSPSDDLFETWVAYCGSALDGPYAWRRSLALGVDEDSFSVIYPFPAVEGADCSVYLDEEWKRSFRMYLWGTNLVTGFVLHDILISVIY